MKTFIGALVSLALILGGIVWYEVTLNQNVDEINMVIQSLSDHIYQEDLEQTESDIDKLEKQWDSMQNWLMAFNDHKEISEISRCLIMLRSYYEYGDFAEMGGQLKTFSLLLNYAVESSKPTLVNIL